MKTISRILIANRGEIAARIARTVRKMGLVPIHVFSDADRESLALNELKIGNSGEAYHLGPAPAAESYLNVDRILEIAKIAKADSVHPGYGFLSEDSSFARRVIEAGLIWIGPSPEAMDRVSSKSKAKALAESAGVPTLEGHRGPQDIASFESAAKEIGYPVLLKAAGGGGGRGIRVVKDATDLAAQISIARSEAEASFGDGELILEKYVPRAHHVEVQVFGDEHGNVVHLGERDCSTQRRHQKIIEESPSPSLSPSLRSKLSAAAVEIARAAGYRNAGTIEFLVEGENFHFLEVNTRLQVEHPVTELVTGLDLVELQIRIARGERLPFEQDDVRFQGHAIELRLCAEDPSAGFRPSTGRISKIHFPLDVRVDDSLVENMVVTPFYDSMLAKIVVAGADRKDAITKSKAALDDTFVTGVTTNRSYLRSILDSSEFQGGTLTTRLLDERASFPPAEVPDHVEAIAAAGFLLSRETVIDCPPPLQSWSNTGLRSTLVMMKSESGVVSKWRLERGQNLVTATKDGSSFSIPLTLPLEDFVHVDGGIVHVQIAGVETRFFDALDGTRSVGFDANLDVVSAPMDGTLSKLNSEAGTHVRKGETLAVLEAMKMQIELKSPRDGRIESVLVTAGAQVKNRQPLLKLELSNQGR